MPLNYLTSSVSFLTMSFREVSDEFREEMQESLEALFLEEEGFGYMKGHERWECFLREKLWRRGRQS